MRPRQRNEVEHWKQTLKDRTFIQAASKLLTHQDCICVEVHNSNLIDVMESNEIDDSKTKEKR